MELRMKMYETTIEWKEEHDDLTTDEMLDIFTRIMLAFGFMPESVKSAVVELANSYKDDDMCDK